MLIVQFNLNKFNFKKCPKFYFSVKYILNYVLSLTKLIGIMIYIAYWS